MQLLSFQKLVLLNTLESVIVLEENTPLDLQNTIP